MRCPYCEGKMRKGQLHAVGARISGDRIAAYNCDFCRKIIVSYEY